MEYASRLKRFDFSHEDCKVVLIEQQETLLPGCSQELIDQSTHACKQAGIECVHGAYVRSIEDQKLLLSDGNKIDFCMLVLSIGVISEKLKFSKKIERSQRNQFLVDSFLRIKGFDTIFALGDVAYFEDEKGHMLLPTAQNAKQQAKTLAKNLQHMIENKDIEKYRYHHRGTLVDLSKKDATGDAFGININGKSAYSLKRTVNAMHIRIFK